VPLSKSLAHSVYLSLQLFQVRFELGHPLLPIAEAPMEAVGILPASATAATVATTAMAAVTGTGVPAPVVLTPMAFTAAGIIAARGMAAVTGTGTPATVVAFTASAAAATAF